MDMREQDMDDFLAEIEYVSKEVSDLVNGKTDVQASIDKEKRKKAIEEIRRREAEEKVKAEEERLAQGVRGKGEKFDHYESFCQNCMLEFKRFREFCYACGRRTITSEQRKQYLMEKVEELKKERASRAEKKVKWENWKKTQSMLYKKTATIYRKWDFFVDEEEEEEQMDFVPPENDPNFKALEDDIKERAQKRKIDLREANVLKDKGNEFFKQGKYRNALNKYEEAQERKKDYMILYTNSAIARIKLEDFEGAIKDCTRVLEYCEIFEDGYEKSRDTCFKALIRRGEAHRNIQKISEAIADFTAALDLKHDSEIETLLERVSQEQRDEAETEETEIETTDANEIISQLDSKEKILGFIHSSGCVTLFKRVLENKDTQALKVLEFLCQDETNYSYLRPMLSNVYDKRRIGMVVLIEAIERYIEDDEWTVKICQLVWLCLENLHIREEIVKHSACTKGKKVCSAIFQLFVTAKTSAMLKAAASCISNLCLSKYKSSFERKPNPGNIKAIVRHNWEAFIPQFLEFLKELSTHTEALGLLCNLSTEPKMKALFIGIPEVMESALDTIQHGVKSLPVERSLGFLINACTSPTSMCQLEPYFEQILTGINRVATLTNTTNDITYRGYLLLFRLLLARPDYGEQLSKNREVLRNVFNALDQSPDIAVKIVTAAASSTAFCREVPVNKIIALAKDATEKYDEDSKVHERLGNLGLAVGKIAQNVPDNASKFKCLVEPFVKIVKDSLGPVRKNLAVCLGKLADNEVNREELRRVHGIEVLHSVQEFLNK